MRHPESDALFRAVFEQNAVGVALLETRTGRYLRVNQSHCDLLGYTREELERIGFQTITHPDDLGPDIALMERVLAGEARSFTMEKRYFRKDGSLVWVNLTVSPLWRPGEEPDFHVAVVVDITDKKRAEEALRESEARYRAHYHEAPVMLHAIDADGRLVNVSNRWLEVLGYRRDEVIGRRSTEFLTEESRAYARDVVLPAFFATGRCSDVAYRFVKRDGGILDVELSAVAEWDANGKFVCSRAVLIDVTERKRIEETLRQAQKMESVGRLAGGVAHDFNNLLAAILGNVELAELHAADTDALAHDLAEVRRAAERAAALTRQLLAFSRKQVLQPQMLCLNDVVRGVDTMLHRLIGADIRLVVTLADDLLPTRADPGQLEQVLVNLALNARDAMPSGGTLTVATRNADDRAAVYLEVSDTGIGMDEDTRAHIFEPFFTTKGRGKGTGLGLATVYGIVKQSGGEILVTSEPGAGTQFRVSLPAEAGRAASPDAGRVVARRPTGTETVLVVEDEPIVRQLAVRVLQDAGYHVLAAEDGARALAVCDAYAGPIHLAVTDVVMPHLGGAEFARRALAVRPKMRVLFTSGYPEEELGTNGVLAEGTAFLGKPFTASELARRVRETLDVQTSRAVG